MLMQLICAVLLSSAISIFGAEVGPRQNRIAFMRSTGMRLTIEDSSMVAGAGVPVGGNDEGGDAALQSRRDFFNALNQLEHDAYFTHEAAGEISARYNKLVEVFNGGIDLGSGRHTAAVCLWRLRAYQVKSRLG